MSAVPRIAYRRRPLSLQRISTRCSCFNAQAHLPSTEQDQRPRCRRHRDSHSRLSRRQRSQSHRPFSQPRRQFTHLQLLRFHFLLNLRDWEYRNGKTGPTSAIRSQDCRRRRTDAISSDREPRSSGRGWRGSDRCCSSGTRCLGQLGGTEQVAEADRRVASTWVVIDA